MTTTNNTIAERVDAMHQEMADQVPAEIIAVFQEEQKGLDAAGTPDGVAVAGSSMPDGDLLDVHGAPTTLGAIRDNKPAVVVLYRGAWCPYCNITLRTYQDQLVGALDSRDAVLVAVSPQRPDGSLTMQESNELKFAVVSDPGNQIAEKLGVLTAPSDDAADAQRSIGLDLSVVNIDGTSHLPMPTVVIVDRSGVIRWIDVKPNYATRTEPTTIIEAFDEVIS